MVGVISNNYWFNGYNYTLTVITLSPLSAGHISVTFFTLKQRNYSKNFMKGAITFRSLHILLIDRYYCFCFNCLITALELPNALSIFQK